ncbi:DUF1820 family protein [Salinispirillum marinum]|uniref:DUF1820 family protein n=2 Tax=Saccharospirillaceae TaxID=255527 RepID=A0ABV8BFL5_9GAMM
MTEKKRVYRVLFIHQDKVYEVFCREVTQSDMYGFIELGGFIFGERSQVLVDPGEEKLKAEFAGVKRSYVAMQRILRIDEMDKEGVAKVRDSSTKGDVTPFPLPPRPAGRN